MRRRRWAVGIVLLGAAAGCFLLLRPQVAMLPHYVPFLRAKQPLLVYRGKLSKAQKLIVEGARDQLTWGTVYDASYCHIPYPGGDVNRKKGACTDVVIRALRHAGYDLQVGIHKDISEHWSLYPRYEYNPHPDPNIDQRRVPNQRVFFARFGKKLSTGVAKPEGWAPGDVIEWRMPHGHDHTGVLSDHLDREGFPLVIHNVGDGPQEEDVLRTWTVTGHFRYPKA
ncbi:MAG TPA: DUF1287 domain-containing protein [Fimbriimonas sp.]|nr:DUF1287 domain-containing protein [Fimbriimonas sp.]